MSINQQSETGLLIIPEKMNTCAG